MVAPVWIVGLFSLAAFGCTPLTAEKVQQAMTRATQDERLLLYYGHRLGDQTVGEGDCMEYRLSLEAQDIVPSWVRYGC